MVSLTRLSRLIQSQLSVGGSELFDLVFYAAVNSTINDLKNDTILDIDFIDEDTHPESLDIDQQYTAVMMEGITYHMQKTAKWARRDEELSDALYRRELDMAQVIAFRKGNVHVGLDNSHATGTNDFIPTYADPDDDV